MYFQIFDPDQRFVVGRDNVKMRRDMIVRIHADKDIAQFHERRHRAK